MIMVRRMPRMMIIMIMMRNHYDMTLKCHEPLGSR